MQPQAFALTSEEILLATDAELNQYMGIKKYAPYRKEGSNWDKNRAARLGELKNQLKERREKMMGGRGLESYDDVVRGGGEGAEKPMKKRKGKKERVKEKAAAAVTENGDGEVKVEHKDSAVCEDAEDEDHGKESDQNNTKSSKKRRRKRKKGAADATST